MEKYQSYKPSNVEWIGEIPSHWKLTRTKYFSTFRNGYSFKSEDWVDDGIPVIRMSNIGDDGKIKLNSKNLNFVEHKNISSLSDFIIQKGDILISMTDMNPEMLWLGSTILFNEEGNWLLNQRVGNIRITKEYVDRKYFHYLSNSDIVRNQLKTSVYPNVQTNLSTEPIKNELIYLPPISEQSQIVQFLDEKTELIDKLISTKERKITLLKEQRTSLINQFVTKGLNPNVKMKDSGVEWIGEIPEHWISLGFTKIIKIRHGYQFREYDFTDNGIKIVKITQLDKEGYLNLDNCSFIDEKRLDEFERILIEENDVLMCLTVGTIGKIIKVGKVDEPLVQNYRVGHFSPLNNNIINDYVFWFMSSSLTTSQMFSEIRETGQPNIGMEDFGKMKVILPPMSEQIEIVRHLEFKTKEIDDLVSLEQKKIDLLKEYRQSLILEVVTGKIKVTN